MSVSNNYLTFRKEIPNNGYHHASVVALPWDQDIYMYHVISRDSSWPILTPKAW